MAHRYYVEWSAPDRVNIGSTVVLASNKREAIRRAKAKIGNGIVKLRKLSFFRAGRIGNRLGRQPGTVVRTFPPMLTRRGEYVKENQLNKRGKV